MRDFIDIVLEAEKPRHMSPTDYRSPGLTIQDITNKPEGQFIEGDHADEMTPEEAKSYLDQHPNGTLHNDWFENDAFITRDIHGNYIFYDPSVHKINDPAAGLETWDWEKDLSAIRADTNEGDPDIETGWWYHPGREMNMCAGGAKWWEAVRNGDYTKDAKHYIP